MITGGIGRNAGLVSKIEQRLDGLEVTLPQEPMIVGALGQPCSRSTGRRSSPLSSAGERNRCSRTI